MSIIQFDLVVSKRPSDVIFSFHFNPSLSAKKDKLTFKKLTFLFYCGGVLLKMSAFLRVLCVMSALVVSASSAPTTGDSHAHSAPGLLDAHLTVSTAQDFLLHRSVEGAARDDVTAAHDDFTAAHDVTPAHDETYAAHGVKPTTHAGTPPIHGHASTAHDVPPAHDASPAHTARIVTSAPASTDGQLRPSSRERQPSARTSAAVARTKRGSGVVIRGPFYPYPRGRGPLRFTSGAAHTRAHALLLPVLAAASVFYTYGLRWA